MPKLNQLAPAFNLLNQDGKKISLKDYRDKKNVVVYFYPKALTPGCTTQACGIRDAKSELKKAGIVVLGISPDAPEKLARFTEKKELNFDLLSDPENKIALKYDAYGLKKFMGREYMGVKRMTFIVGKDGKLKYIMEKVNTKTHHDDIIQYIKENL